MVASTGCTTNTTTQNSSGSGSGNSGIAVAINLQQTASQIGGGYLTDTPKAGDKFLIYDVTVTNLKEKSWNIGNPHYFKLSTAGGAVYEITSSTFLGDKALTSVSNTNPGEKVSGQIAFEVPQSAMATSLTYSDGINQVITTLSGVSSTTTPPVTPTATPPVTPTATPSVLTPTPTPSPTIQVIISGPTTIRNGQGGTWTATVLVNGVALPQSQLTNKINWFIDGHAAGGSWGSGTLTTDANGSETTWAPKGVHSQC